MKYIWLAFLFTTQVFADSWAPPTPMAVVSDNGDFIARVIQGQEGTKAEAFIYKLREKEEGYYLYKQFELFNPTLPASIHISKTGKYLLTFDDYFSVGYGENTMVIYDTENDTSTRYSLEEMCKKIKIENSFPESVSSRWWRETAGFMYHDESIIYIYFNQKNKENRTLTCKYDIRTGSFLEKEHVNYSK